MNYMILASTTQHGGVTMIGVLYLALILALYFLPTILAHLLRHRNEVAVFLFNALLGWTVLGWVIALVWSVCTTQHEQRA